MSNLQRLKEKKDCLLTPKQVSDLIGVSCKNIYTWIKAGAFDNVVMIGSRIYIYESSVEKVLESGVKR